ncbi:MAG TPA: matrixin family metalloprotease [Candidatus Acidoferrales bacterium]|nr:matrixin family metalloprotease [Candidatus Acidoferrales bacterium]
MNSAEARVPERHADRDGVDLGEAFSPDDDFAAALGVANVATFRVREDSIDAGPVEAESLLRSAAAARRSDSRVLIITDRDLNARGLGSLFGFADPHRNAAIVSTARLGDPVDDSKLARRLSNVAHHEIGHLNGLHHCRGPRCVMMRVGTAAELDARALEACGQCPRRFGWLRRIAGLAAAFAILVLSVVALDRVTAKLAGPAPDFPFL